jgi:hypothetical protein
MGYKLKPAGLPVMAESPLIHSLVLLVYPMPEPCIVPVKSISADLVYQFSK